jgi:hypothetical protein
MAPRSNRWLRIPRDEDRLTPGPEATPRAVPSDQRDPALVRTTVETDVAVWLKGALIVRVSILRKDDPRVPGSERAAEFQTFYQVTLLPASPWGGSPSHASSRGEELGDSRADRLRLFEVGEVAAVFEHHKAGSGDRVRDVADDLERDDVVIAVDQQRRDARSS